MANFTPSQKTAQDFNNGVEYVDGIGDIEGDAVHAESINNVIESQLWVQALCTNPVDNTNANSVGTASLSIILKPDGTPQLKISNIKGDKVDPGDPADLSNYATKSYVDNSIQTSITNVLNTAI